MSWIQTKGKKRKTQASTTDDKRASASKRLAVGEAIRRQKQELDNLCERLPEFIKEQTSLETQIAACTGRAQIRKRKSLERKKDEVVKLISSIRSGSLEKDFRRKITPYLRALAYVKNTDGQTGGGGGDESADHETSSEGSGTTTRDKKRRRTSTSLSKTKSGRAKRKAPAAKRAMRVKSNSKSDSGKFKEDTIADEFHARFFKQSPPLYMVSGDSCPFCGVGQMRALRTTSQMVCSECGKASVFVDCSSQAMGYGQDVEYASFSYKRATHFQECLNSFQAKETTEIPDTIMRKICQKLYKQNVSEAQITPKKVREILKSLGLRRFYENTTLICCHLTGKTPPRLSASEEEQLRSMFLAIQGPFEKHCPADRKNFLSYSYCMYKFSELLGLDEFLCCFSLLKGRDKLYRQDQIFEKICAELNWQFIPSV